MLIYIVEETDDPLFVFGVTVQNHTPYLPDKYETTQKWADGGDFLSEADSAHMETFPKGYLDDAMSAYFKRISTFRNFFNEIKSPTASFPILKMRFILILLTPPCRGLNVIFT